MSRNSLDRYLLSIYYVLDCCWQSELRATLSCGRPSLISLVTPPPCTESRILLSSMLKAYHCASHRRVKGRDIAPTTEKGKTESYSINYNTMNTWGWNKRPAKQKEWADRAWLVMSGLYRGESSIWALASHTHRASLRVSGTSSAPGASQTPQIFIITSDITALCHW